MRSIASVLSIIALGFGLLSCSSSGGGGGGGSTSAVAVSTTAADFGVVGNTYTSTLVATGGTAPFTWTVSSGVLPPGLSLNAGTGVVSSTLPLTVAGNSTVVFVVTDSTGTTATGSVLFAIHPRTDLLSVDNGTPPVPGSAASSRPAISNNGRFVAFASSASNLIPGVSGPQIYLHDWQTNQTSLVSKNNQGNPASGGSTTTSPSISSDGRFVAYVSDATNLVFGVGGQQVYLHDSQTSIEFPNGQTTLVSKDNISPTPQPGNGVSSSPSISQYGCFVAFASVSTNFGVAGGNQQIYVRGPLPGPGIGICPGTEQTSLVSKDNSLVPVAGTGLSSVPSISQDGCFVAFVSLASNLVPLASGQQIYVRGPLPGPGICLGTEQTSLVSKDNLASPGNGLSSSPSISQEGCFVAFASVSTNLGVPGGNQQIYVRGPLPGPGIGICPGTEQTSLVSKDNSPVPMAGNGLSSGPSVNANGGFVAFSSLSTNLVLPAPGNQQIYVRVLP